MDSETPKEHSTTEKVGRYKAFSGEILFRLRGVFQVGT